jgi:NAD-dependent deacetylase
VAAQAGVPITIMNMGHTQYDSIASHLISEPIQDALPKLVHETLADSKK